MRSANKVVRQLDTGVLDFSGTELTCQSAGAIWTDWWTTIPIDTRGSDWGSYLVKNYGGCTRQPCDYVGY